MVYRYDAAERLDRITYPGGTNVFRGYDELGRLETISAGTLLGHEGRAPPQPWAQSIDGLRGQMGWETSTLSRTRSGLAYLQPPLEFRHSRPTKVARTDGQRDLHVLRYAQEGAVEEMQQLRP